MLPRASMRVRLGGLGPSLGAAASLVAAGVALALLVAGLLGAPVWPGASDAQGEELTLAAPPVSDVAVPEPVGGTDFVDRARRGARARDARPPAHAVAPHGAAPARAAACGSRAGDAHDAGRAEHAGGERVAPRRATAAGGPTAVAAAAARRPRRSRNRRRRRLSPEPVEQTVSAVREAAAPVTDALPAPVATVVDQVLDTVQQTAATVDQTLDPVTGLLQRKP